MPVTIMASNVVNKLSMQMYRNEHVSYDKQPNALVDTVNGSAYPRIMYLLSQSRIYIGLGYRSVEQLC